MSINIADQEAIDLTLPVAARKKFGRNRETADCQCSLEDWAQTDGFLPARILERLRKIELRLSAPL